MTAAKVLPRRKPPEKIVYPLEYLFFLKKKKLNFLRFVKSLEFAERKEYPTERTNTEKKLTCLSATHFNRIHKEN
jgi:hypothetical protein